MSIIWYPTEKIVTGFKYATYVMLAPLLLLSFIFPASLTILIFFLFLILRSIVLIRGAVILPSDDEMELKFDIGKESAKKASKITAILFSVMSLVVLVFFFLKGGMHGFFISLLIPMLVLPSSYAEVIKLNKKGKEN